MYFLLVLCESSRPSGDPLSADQNTLLTNQARSPYTK